MRKWPEQLLLRALYEEYGAAVVALIRRKIRDQRTAEDILQETMLRGGDLMISKMQSATLQPYLVTMVRSAIIGSGCRFRVNAGFGSSEDDTMRRRTGVLGFLLLGPRNLRIGMQTRRLDNYLSIQLTRVSARVIQ